MKGIAEWNAEQLLTLIQHEGLIVFGAKYPIALEQPVIDKLSNMAAPEAAEMFAAYLHEKQKDDYYYAKARIYKNGEGETQGVYTLTQDTLSIFPLQPYIPFNSGIAFDFRVDSWNVSLVKYDDSGYTVAGRLDFQDFASKSRLSERRRFDASHVIIELNGQEMAELVKEAT